MADSFLFVWTLNTENWGKWSYKMPFDVLQLWFTSSSFWLVAETHWGLINNLDFNSLILVITGPLRLSVFYFLFFVCLWSWFAFVSGQFSEQGDNYKVTISFKPRSRRSLSFCQTQQIAGLMDPVDEIQREPFVFPLVCETKRWPLLTTGPGVLQLVAAEIEFWGRKKNLIEGARESSRN